MFAINKAGVEAIRGAFEECDELAAAVEVRRRSRGISDFTQAHAARSRHRWLAVVSRSRADGSSARCKSPRSGAVVQPAPMSGRNREWFTVNVCVTLAALAAVVIGTTIAQAASEDADALLRSLIGKDEETIERSIGLPDQSERNGVQTFLHYRAFDSWWISSRPYPFGYTQGFSGALGFRGTADFDCVTTLVLVDGNLRAYTRQGNGCR
jgi:hypothetical protein